MVAPVAPAHALGGGAAAMTALAQPMPAYAATALTTARVAAIVALIGATLSPPLANVAAGVMLIALALVPDAWERLRRVLAEPLGRGVLVLAAALLFACAVGIVGGTSTLSAAMEDLRSWRTLLLLIAALAVFDDPRWKTRLALAFVVFACVAALVTLVTWKIGFIYKDHPLGVLLRNTVTQAITFACGAFLALLLAASASIRAPAARVALALAALGLVAHLVFLETGRSGHVTLVVAALVAVLLMSRGRKRVVALAAVPALAVLAFAISPQLQQRFQKGLDEAQNAETLPVETSMGARMIIWRTTAGLIRERPILGYGLGGFAPAYAERVKQLNYRDWQAIPANDTHNQYARLWVEGGLPLLLAFGWFLFAAWRQPAAMPYRAAGIALLAAWCVTSLVSSHFRTFGEGHLIMLFLGAFLARERSDQPDGSASTVTPS
jgi:O-antigen ligase